MSNVFSAPVDVITLDFTYLTSLAPLGGGGSFPDSSVGKESTCNAGDPGSIPVRKIHWRRDRLPSPVFLDFPCGSSDKESTCNAGDLGSIPGSQDPLEKRCYFPIARFNLLVFFLKIFTFLFTKDIGLWGIFFLSYHSHIFFHMNIPLIYLPFYNLLSLRTQRLCLATIPCTHKYRQTYLHM